MLERLNKDRLKISISYPPLESPFGVPLLSQNRQFQWFKNPTYIYPVVPACAATLLKNDGFDVIWDDAISEGKDFEQWLKDLEKERPDIIAMETKTPVVKRHWKIIDRIKLLQNNGWKPLFVLMGDHVTALPRESMVKSKVDFVLTGGDYDFLLLSLARYLARRDDQLEPGIWYRDGERIKYTGHFRLDHDINTLPHIDRDLTKWHLYSTQNGNFKRLPGTYIMAGRDCWWGRCTFCSWTTMYPVFRVRKPASLIEEIRALCEEYHVREIMDDTGTFPGGTWLREFSKGMIETGLNRKVTLDCNMRFGILTREDYRVMKRAGFRLLLFGIESANNSTLKRLNKGLTIERMIDSLRDARCEGLYPHITIMFGYPWEDYNDALNTLRLGRWLLKKGLAWTVQATMVIPYPGTPLYEYCKEKGLLLTDDWDDFDMKRPVIKTPFPEDMVVGLVHAIYSTAFSAEFILRRIVTMRDMDDLRYAFRGVKKVVGHLMDFR